MRLSIALATAAIVLRFQTPGAGTFYVWSQDSALHARMVFSGYTTNASHVSVRLPRDADMALFKTEFVQQKW